MEHSGCCGNNGEFYPAGRADVPAVGTIIIMPIFLFLCLLLFPFIEQPILSPAAATNVSSVSSDRITALDSASPRVLPTIAHMGDVEGLILTMTNDIRQKHGLNRLRREPALQSIARGHSDDMIIRKFFAHVNPDGHNIGDRVVLQHRRLIGDSGENIWRYGSILEINGREEPAYIRLPPQQIAEKVISSWMDSPGHRENILRPQFTHLGVGVSMVKGEITATQNFAAVRAYINMALPKRVSKGGFLKLDTTSYPASMPQAERYDYWMENKKKAVGDPMPITESRVEVARGVYRIRFYFPIPEGYMIYGGPRIEIR